MITDIIDLEQLLNQYEPEAVLVGPLLSLSLNASYRYFYLAGNNSTIYSSIGLGFFENESCARKQRADIIERLRPRFAELLLFDSQMEMTRAVHARWRTEETARALATAEREAKAASALQVENGDINERGYESTLRNEQTERQDGERLTDSTSVADEQRLFETNQADQLAGEAAVQESPKSRGYQGGLASNDRFHEFVGTLVDDSHAKPNLSDGIPRVDMTAELLGPAVSSNPEPNNVAGRDTGNGSGASKDHDHQMDNLTRKMFEHAVGDEKGSIRLPPAATLPPLGCGDAAAARQNRDRALTEDDIASAILRLASPAQLDNHRIPAVDAGRSLTASPAVLAVEPIHPESASIVPVKQPRGQPTVRWLVTTAAAIVLLLTFVVPNTRQDVEQAGNAFPAGVTKLPSKSAAAVPSLPVSQRADASQSGRPTEAALSAAPPSATAAPSQPENSGAGAVPVSEKHKAITQQARTADLPGSREIAKLVSRGMESLKSGDLKSARLSLQRAVEAIPGPAAAQGEPSQTIPEPDTSQTSAVKQLGRQTEHSPAIKPSSAVGQPSQVAKLDPGSTPTSVPTAPPQEASTIRHLDPNEIAILLSQGMDLLKSGDFASARLSLRRAAEAGNADAALALGSTYDPFVLRQLDAIGIAADTAQAQQWYQKAMDFGSAAAAQRLARLAQAAH
jgi:hypothetical protein